MDIVVQTIWKETYSNCTQEKKKTTYCAIFK